MADEAAHYSVIFDLGAVLIDWNPRHLYRQLLPDEAAIEHFLATVCTQAWNEEQDAGRPFADGIALLCEQHPMHAELISAYFARWHEMLGGPIEDTVAILRQLHDRGVPLYALTNWSAETFPHARARFEFLTLFRGILVSGEERLKKPDPRIFQRLLSRYGLTAPRSIFIDDSEKNVRAARELGMIGLHFRSSSELERELAGLGVL
jgi:2-haloacid dehalogenase